MQRARRAAAVAVVAMTGGLMLAGCQSQPSVAAYVGNTRISVDQVNTIVDDFDATSRATQGGGLADTSYGNARQVVLADLVLTEAVKRYAKDQNLTTPPADVDGAAQDLREPASSLYVNLVAETRTYLALVTSRSSATQPTDADVRGIYDSVPHGDVTYADAKPQIEAIDHLPDAIGVRNDLEKIFNDYHVVLNPQYRGTTFRLLSQTLDDGSSATLVAVSLGSSTDDGAFVSSS